MSKIAIYDHKVVENNLYDFWKGNQLFEPIAKNKKTKNFSIILPPPNVTGQLHLGHAWDGALQDTMIRYKKLQGFRTIWIPGTDHAGIASQTKFEKVLKEKGINRYDMPDQEFLDQLFKWSTEQTKYIHKQWAKLGFALSYENEVYTLDDNVSQLVKTVFKKLYDEKLIYRAKKLVNWDVVLKTAISDIEVIHREAISKMYYFKYVVDGTKDFITIATTRPETMFVDVAVFVNPKDKKYKNYVGKYVVNPINGQKLKVYQDSYVDMKFGTGAMKCTPAHDFNDYQLALKHGIKDYKSVINNDGTLNDLARTTNESYENLDRLVAREGIVADMQSNNLLVKVENHTSEIGYSERTGEIVEPLLSEQWFVKMAPLAKETLRLMTKSKPNFIPPRFKKTMDRWLHNVQDWCISRQLLWGHRLPVWYHEKTKKTMVSVKPVTQPGWVQDKDVLDTWFSSGLWPLALTKYAKAPTLVDFYPVDMLVTGYDILFFWVARMFFQCGHESKVVPLKNIFFHGLIRDELNRKMSKSLNNGIDPMKVIDEYGADALRMFLTSTATVGEDLRFSNEKINHYWSFINKIWNAHNFIGQFKPTTNSIPVNLNPINAWIVNKYNVVLKSITTHMNAHNFVVANHYLVNFVWEDFCNHYLEFAKPLLNDAKCNRETVSVINTIFKNILILLHPHAPFISDYLYCEMYTDKKSIMLESWPVSIKASFADTTDALMSAFCNIYTFARELRTKMGIKQTALINVKLITKEKVQLVNLNELLQHFNIEVQDISNKRINQDAKIATFDNHIIEYENEYLTKEQEVQKLQSELKYFDNEVKRSQNILGNKSFVAKAPKEKVLLEKKKLQQYREQYQKIKATLKQILEKN